MGDERAGSPGRCDREPLSGTDLTDFLALWRVCGNRDSRVEQVAGEHYVEAGRPVLPFLADGLAALIEVGHLTLGEPGPAAGGGRPLVVTAGGRARYEDLCDRQGVAPSPVVAGTATLGEGTRCPQVQRVRGESDGSPRCGDGVRSAADIEGVRAIFLSTGDDPPALNTAVRDALGWVSGLISAEELIDEYFVAGQDYHCFTCPVKNWR